jgi:hypothetical protein
MTILFESTNVIDAEDIITNLILLYKDQPTKAIVWFKAVYSRVPNEMVLQVLNGEGTQMWSSRGVRFHLIDE